MNALRAIPVTSRLYGLSTEAANFVINAAQALKTGRACEAGVLIGTVLQLYPNHPEALRLKAGELNLRGLHGQAIEIMRACLAQRPKDALYHNTLGSILIDAGDLDTAIMTLRHACTLDRKLVAAHYNFALALTRSMRTAEAQDALLTVVALAPKHADARVLLADAMKAKGMIDEAAAAYREVIRNQPDAGSAWWGLADLKVIELTESDIIELKSAILSPLTTDFDRVKLDFALAKALDDRGRVVESFEALGRANGLSRQRQTWDAQAFSGEVDRSLAVFAEQKTQSSDPAGEEVIFVVGMPRSGTTLVEQILSAHSQVEGGGELPDLTLTLAEEAKRQGRDVWDYAEKLSSEQWGKLGRRYLERTRKWRTRRPRFTDKFPGNWRLVGAILAMLPSSRIVCCRRDPIETCLACYRQYLAGNEYSRTFDDLASYWGDFDRAIRHWKTTFPDRIYEIHLEKLTSDPHCDISKLLNFCRLPFELNCLDFHKSRRSVFSPSAAQVRQPMRNDTSRSHRYGPLLDPLRAALTAARKLG